jgi:long-chain acyl-CoA synthetase
VSPKFPDGLRQSEHRPRIPGEGPQTVADVLGPGLAECPEREALVCRHKRFTYAELDREVDRAVAALSDLGIQPGDRVACCLGNYSELVVAFLATQRLGALWVGLNRPLAPPEKSYILADAGVRLLLADDDMAAQVEGVRGEAPSLERIVVLRPGQPDCQWKGLLDAAKPATQALPKVDAFAPSAISYTSGTTGFPKGAVHSQHNLLLPGAVAAVTGSYPSGQIHGGLLPLTILNLVVLVPLLSFQIRGTCVCMDRLDPVGIADWVRRERIGHFAAVPTIYHGLLTHPEIATDDLVTLVRPEVGGAECPEEFLRLYRERFGADVSIGYGMTEAPTAVTRSKGDSPPSAGLCGRALPQIQIHIVDKDGTRLGAGEIGEICVGAASEGIFAGVYTPMLGYWNKPKETADALEGDLYHSGDLGLLDDDGDLYIRGRRNELILRGGANVYPAEVERVLASHDTVGAAAVLGVADERLGERVVAVIESAGEDNASEAELSAFCTERLARYKVPERFVFVEALPRNAMGKVIKPRLRELIG